MIPDADAIQLLWDKYHFPPNKRTHVSVVAAVATALGARINEHANGSVDLERIRAAALLHDIDKQAEKLPDERHPDAGVRILREEGMEELAEIVRTHPLHMILDSHAGPTTLEQQIVFIADKMVKYDFIGMDARFELWRKEPLTEKSRSILEASYPKAIELRDRLLELAGITEGDIKAMV